MCQADPSVLRCRIDDKRIYDSIRSDFRMRGAFLFLEKAVDKYGLPWDAPVELHIADEGEAGEYLKLSRKAVRISS